MLFNQEYLVPERTISKWALHKMEIFKRRKFMLTILLLSPLYIAICPEKDMTRCAKFGRNFPRSSKE